MEEKNIFKDAKVENRYWPSGEMKERAWVTDPEIYKQAKAIPTLILI